MKRAPVIPKNMMKTALVDTEQSPGPAAPMLML